MTTVTNTTPPKRDCISSPELKTGGVFFFTAFQLQRIFHYVSRVTNVSIPRFVFSAHAYANTWGYCDELCKQIGENRFQPNLEVHNLGPPPLSPRRKTWRCPILDKQ